MIQAFK